MYGSVLGPDGLPLPEYDVMKLKYGNRIDIHKLFPPAFTLACCLIFLVPSWMLIYAKRNPIVAHFNTYWVYLLLVIPVIIAWAHVKHTRKQAPDKWAVILALCVPSMMLFLGGLFIGQDAGHMAKMLQSTDCDAFKAKGNLADSWEVAYNSYMTCVNQTNYGSNVPLELLMKNFRLEDCSEYSAIASKNSKDWNYLRYLEESQGCSGWCYPAQQLWAVTPYKDSCATAVSSAYTYLVKPHAVEIEKIMIVVLIVTAVMLMFIGPHMRALGYEW